MMMIMLMTTTTVMLKIEVQHVLALAVDPLTENIFYILDLDR